MNEWRTIKATDLAEATELAWELATIKKQDDDGSENVVVDDVVVIASGVHYAKKKDPSFSY